MGLETVEGTFKMELASEVVLLDIKLFSGKFNLNTVSAGNVDRPEALSTITKTQGRIQYAVCMHVIQGDSDNSHYNILFP